MNLQEIIQANEEYKTAIIRLECHMSKLKHQMVIINSLVNLDEFKQLSYSKAKEIRRLLYNNMSFEQNDKLLAALNQIKESEYSQLKQAHYYPIINEMDFITDDKKRDLDKLLRGLSHHRLFLASLGWLRLKFNKETTEKVSTFLCDKGIIEKVYEIKCGCDGGDCDGEEISQQRYDEFVQYHSLTPNMSDACKGYIEVSCWNDGSKVISDLDTFLKEINVYAYKIISEPDLSFDDV